MENFRNFVEYYDEFFPVTESELSFFSELSAAQKKPSKFLEVGCSTGLCALHLAKLHNDVTGIEVIKNFLDSAFLKNRSPILPLRYFKLSTTEMGNFLGKNFYNIIYTLNDRIVLIPTKNQMKDFFHNCKQMLTENGYLILNILNFEYLFSIADEKKNSEIPTKTTIRAKLISHITCTQNGVLLNRKIETGNGKLLPVFENTKIYPLTKTEICEFGKQAGFTNFEFYADYNKNPLTENSPELVCVLS